jgi:hypothetical protein
LIPYSLGTLSVFPSFRFSFFLSLSHTHVHFSPLFFGCIQPTEDDEFEEFDPAHWNKDSIMSEEEATQQWMENWDDDMANASDFLASLRQELHDKNGK